MAMSNDTDDIAFGDDIALYRSHAREAPTALADARVMRAAAIAAGQRRTMTYLPWLGAVAAGLALWLGLAQSFKPMPAPAANYAQSSPPGYLEGRTRTYLMQMDVRASTSDTANYLLQYTSP